MIPKLRLPYYQELILSRPIRLIVRAYYTMARGGRFTSGELTPPPIPVIFEIGVL